MTKSNERIAGSCLCGGVQYEAEGPLEMLAICHCEQCRKASGAEFGTNGNVASASFKVVSGEELLRAFESSPGQERVFCGRCGSPIMKRVAARPERVRLRVGCVDTELEQRPGMRVFVSEKLGLTRIPDDIPSFDTLPNAERRK